MRSWTEMTHVWMNEVKRSAIRRCSTFVTSFLSSLRSAQESVEHRLSAGPGSFPVLQFGHWTPCLRQVCKTGKDPGPADLFTQAFDRSLIHQFGRHGTPERSEV